MEEKGRHQIRQPQSTDDQAARKYGDFVSAECPTVNPEAVEIRFLWFAISTKCIGRPPGVIFSICVGSSASVNGLRSIWPRQRLMFANSPPASPDKGMTDTSASWPFLPFTKKLPTRMEEGACSF